MPSGTPPSAAFLFLFFTDVTIAFQTWDKAVPCQKPRHRDLPEVLETRSSRSTPWAGDTAYWPRDEEEMHFRGLGWLVSQTRKGSCEQPDH